MNIEKKNSIIIIKSIIITEKSILSNGNLFLTFRCIDEREHGIADILLNLNIEEANALIKRIEYMIKKGWIRDDKK